MTIISDVVIVGAGIVGSSATFHLAKLGQRVIVVEKGAVASGQTKRSSALVCAHYPLDAEARLALAGLRYFRNWGDLVGGKCEFTPTGFVRLASDAARLRERVAQLARVGVNVQLLSGEELGELLPGVRTDNVSFAAYEPDAGFADPIAATQAFAARAKEFGAKFQTGTFVKNIRVERGRVAGLDTNIGSMEALTVIVTAGPWTDRLLKPLGIEIGIQPVRADVAFFERPTVLKSGHPAFWDAGTGAYFRPHTFGLTLGGPTAIPSESTNPDHFDENVSPAFVSDLQSRMAARLPAMAQARYVRGHVGILDMTPDRHAVIDRATEIHGLVIAAGFSGTGFALAPAVGACLAEWVTDGEVRSIDLNAFRLSRFEKRDA